MHTRKMFVFFFGTSTGFANQVEIFISRMKFAFRSRSISAPGANRSGSERRLVVCLTGFASLYTSSKCSANSLGIPGMSDGSHANIFQYSRRSLTRALSYAGERLEDTNTVFDLSVGWIGCFVVSFFESMAESGVGFLSDFWNSPLIVMGPLGPGIFSLR